MNMNTAATKLRSAVAAVLTDQPALWHRGFQQAGHVLRIVARPVRGRALRTKPSSRLSRRS